LRANYAQKPKRISVFARTEAVKGANVCLSRYKKKTENTLECPTMLSMISGRLYVVVASHSSMLRSRLRVFEVSHISQLKIPATEPSHASPIHDPAPPDWLTDIR